ncbi:hypothetical protein HPB51_002572 [Rhipicephalus microplus]|uniref:Uncharacterized protein n=1 Tax=Rhipicephalus microplus TaxID=6941 RepID=A0A9J6DES3_RHIMP|nr:hypothetical protein HPB51_002572 [Rhipicephalus microplus]
MFTWRSSLNWESSSQEACGARMLSRCRFTGKKTKCSWVWTLSCTCSLAAVVMTVVIYFRDRRVSGEVYPGYVVESSAFYAPFRWSRNSAYRMTPASGNLLIQPPEGICAKAFGGDNSSAPQESIVVVVHSAPHHFEHRYDLPATAVQGSIDAECLESSCTLE